MPCLKMMHFTASITNGETKIDILKQLEESTCINSILNELHIKINMISASSPLYTSNTVSSVIKGLTRNKSNIFTCMHSSNSS